MFILARYNMDKEIKEVMKMKKTFITASLLVSLMATGVASANEFLPETNKIKSDVETVMVRQGSTKNGPQYAVIDRNPTGYTKQVVDGHTIESWIKDDVVFTAVDGVIVKKGTHSLGAK